MMAGDSSYVKEVMRLFAGARGVQGKLETCDHVDPFNVGSFMINGQSGEDLIAVIDRAMAKHALLVFLFHGVGGEHTINVSLDAHRKLLQYLKKQGDDVWVATMVELVSWVKKRRGL